MNKKALLLLLLICQVSSVVLSQSRKKTNWIEDKKSHITRWRLGFGVAAAEPTGAHLQFYKLSGICTQTIRVRKMISVNLSASYEGLMLSEQISKQNEHWTSGGLRAGIDFLYYIPLAFRPYIGIGGDIGNRTFLGKSVSSPDAIGRLGFELKILGIRTSTKTLLHTSIFAEAKYSYGLKHNFSYLLPMAGLRFHFL
ncbi:MAG: hypothetical protein RBR68_11180 [Tenuifilaceae bacterium]|nr:hypothetical protein [Tenuifilaceae bacterium]